MRSLKNYSFDEKKILLITKIAIITQNLVLLQVELHDPVRKRVAFTFCDKKIPQSRNSHCDWTNGSPTVEHTSPCVARVS